MSTEPTACEPTQVDTDELVAEIERYLAAVETFRAEGCEPAWADDEALTGSWRLEWPAPAAVAPTPGSSPSRRPPDFLATAV